MSPDLQLTSWSWLQSVGVAQEPSEQLRSWDRRWMLALWLTLPFLLALIGYSLRADRSMSSLTSTSMLAQQVHTRCVEQMVRNTCVAMRSTSAGTLQSVARTSQPDTAPSQVFIAGLGSVDAQAYRQIRDAGEAMCSVALRACDADPRSDACRTAQSLWPR